MTIRNVQRDANGRQERDRHRDETMIACDLQAGGMARSDALRAAARHVAERIATGQRIGGTAGISRSTGDNGGPIINDSEAAEG